MAKTEQERAGSRERAESRGRTKKGRFRQLAETPANDAKVIELWAAGWLQKEIAAEMGWKHESSVSRAITRGYKAIVAPHVDEARKRSMDRLDHAHKIARKVLDKDHILVSQGRVMRDPETNEVLLDDAPKLAAIDRIVKVEQRIATCLGLDAASKASVEVITRDVVATRLEELTKELEKNDPVDDESAEV